MPDNSLSEAEFYIMQHFWESGPMKTDQLAAKVGNKNWKLTTLLTFLSRLVAKEMLLVKKQGKGNLYSPIVTSAQYKEGQAKQFLNHLYQGSAQNFLAALVEGQSISGKELLEMRKWLNLQEVDENG